MEEVYNYKDTWASRERVDPCTLNKYAGTVKLLIENNNKHLESRGHKTRKKTSFERHRTALWELHNEYVLVPADKASNNIIIICKKYYTEVLRNELAAAASAYVLLQLLLKQFTLQPQALQRTVSMADFDDSAFTANSCIQLHMYVHYLLYSLAT